MESVLQNVHGLLIPMAGDPLLLPNAAVAEISAYRPAETVDGGPDWLAGLYEWRGLKIPLVTFETMCGGQEVPKKFERVAVFNNLNGNERMPFFAIATQGIPRLTQVNSSILTATPSEEVEQGPIKESVLLNGEPARIPDLDEMEKSLLGIEALVSE